MDILTNVVNNFTQSFLYEGVLSKLPGGFDDPYTAFGVVALTVVVLFIIFIKIIVHIAKHSGKKKTFKQANKSVSVKPNHKNQKQQSKPAVKNATVVPTQSVITREKYTDDIKDIDINKILMAKAREKAKLESQVKKDVNEFEQIIVGINKRKIEAERLRKQNQKEEEIKKRNMSVLDDKVASKYRIEGNEKNDSQEEIKRLQEAEKQQRIKELAERKKRKVVHHEDSKR